MQRPRALDTSPEIERLPIERWRATSRAGKASIVSSPTGNAPALGIADLLARALLEGG